MKRTLENILLTKREFYCVAKQFAQSKTYKTLRRWQSMIPLFDAHYRELFSIGRLPLWKFQLYNAELHRKGGLYTQAIDFQAFPKPIPNCPRPDYYDAPEQLLLLLSEPLPPWLLDACPKLKSALRKRDTRCSGGNYTERQGRIKTTHLRRA